MYRNSERRTGTVNASQDIEHDGLVGAKDNRSDYFSRLQFPLEIVDPYLGGAQDSLYRALRERVRRGRRHSKDTPAE